MITLYDTDKKTILATAVKVGVMKHDYSIVTPHPAVNNVKRSSIISHSFDVESQTYPIKGFQTITRDDQDFRFNKISETEFYLIGNTENVDTSREGT